MMSDDLDIEIESSASDVDISELRAALHESPSPRRTRAAERSGRRSTAAWMQHQAPGFYSDLGYTKVGERVDARVGFSEMLFQKRLADDA